MNDKELKRLIELFLKAEKDIVNEIGSRLRSMGLVDYHAVVALERIQAILRKLESDCWQYVPIMIEKQFYVRVPEARAISEPVSKHVAGYLNAYRLTAEQTAIVELLVMNLMADITDATMTTMTTLQNAIIGRLEPDVYRRVGLEQVANIQAIGKGLNRGVPAFVKQLLNEGVTAFVDKAGRRWSLHTYGSMVLRTTSRQAEVAAVLTAHAEHDLYRISDNDSGCKICAPFEGRVFSKSGTNPHYPPLSLAFGKVDVNGPDSLTNTYLNLHPNCRHAISEWTEDDKTEEEIEEIRKFSSPKTNPITKDPRTEKEKAAYRKKEEARRHWLERYRTWEKYRMALGDKVPKTFETFQKHMLAGDEKYTEWKRLFCEAKEVEKYSHVRYHSDGTVVVTDRWTGHRSTPSTYKPNAVVDMDAGKQIDRTFYDNDGKMVRQVHSGNHNKPKQHPFGLHGEHAHDFIYNESNVIVNRSSRELTDEERIENGDII